MELFDTTFSAVEKALDLRTKRHMLLSSNVANSETPNYRSRELDFAGELQKALDQNPSPVEKTNPMHLDIGSSQAERIVLDNSGAMGADGNNVDLDIAMGKLSSNVRAYNDAVGYLAMKLRLLRGAITGAAGG